ncbi:DNA mismatch repair endonuclease MutL [bacterium]|jgi:DNA mismatch repair protein MutL|nr:DNA mismatch repair endonuclease MutL [bacterium]
MIQILDSKTINKIAAGEVIDRPVSVVKELVDNAIDAKATTIQLTIKQGGKELIQIQDNGGGIPKKELSLAPIQHATSKISKLEDLFETASLGFRGEALSSIGHVADLNITSRTKSGDSGYSIHVNDGVISDTKPIAHEIGTSVKVIEIFDNIPVRKRFLKASNTEFSYIYELVLHYAFVFPTINFVLSHDGKEVLNSSGISDYIDLTQHFFGKKVSEQCVPINFQIGDATFTGVLGVPSLTFSNRNKQIFSVNKRLVKSMVLSKALKIAYKDDIPSNRFPFIYLNIEIPSSSIDINIHPQKQDIKFLSPGFVFDCVPKVVRISLSEANYAREIESIQSPPPSNQPNQSTNLENAFFRTNESSIDELVGLNSTNSFQNDPNQAFTDPNDSNNRSNTILNANSISFSKNNIPQENNEFNTNQPSQLFTKSTFKALEADRIEFLQVFNTYIIVKSDTGMWILDQHAVHERVLYERIKKNWKKSTDKQALLISEVIELSTETLGIFMENRDYFWDLNFTIEEFGAKQIVVREIPLVFANSSIKPLILDILDQLKSIPFSSTNMTLEQKEKLQMMACKAAIKAGKVMSELETKHLIKDLIETPSNYTCPHGRPLFIKYDKIKLEKLFLRR